MTIRPVGEDGARHPPTDLDSCHVLVVSHAADRSGAPLLLLWWLRWLASNTDLEFEILVLRDGPLVAEFRAVAPTHVIDVYSPPTGPLPELVAAVDLAERLEQHRVAAARRAGRALGRFDVVVLNSVLAGAAMDLLSERPRVVVSWIHDMGTSFSRYAPEAARNAVLDADFFLTCADVVSDTLIGAHGVDRSRVRRHHGFVEPVETDDEGAASVRAELGIPLDALVIGGAGSRQWRKGTDLFVQVLHRVRSLRPDLDVHGVWAGGGTPSVDAPPEETDARALGLTDRFHLLASYRSAAAALGAFDVFCLTSREDPFPLVMLEAGWLSLPVVSFDNGGVRELASAAGADLDPLVSVVDYLDVEAFAQEVSRLLDDARDREEAGGRLHGWVSNAHLSDVVAPRMLEDLQEMVQTALAPGYSRPAVHAAVRPALSGAGRP